MREMLKSNLANLIRDYRSGEIPPRDENVIERWVMQFPEASQNTILQELTHVLNNSYLTLQTTRTLLRDLVLRQDFPAAYWASANFLQIQLNGTSQVALTGLLDQVLQENYGLRVGSCGSHNGPYVYLDDILFTGGRVKHDLLSWIRLHAPANARVDVLMLAVHRFGAYELERKVFPYLSEQALSLGKNIEFRLFDLCSFENRRAYANRSGVYWPTFPQSQTVLAYAQQQNAQHIHYRDEMMIPNSIFSSEAGRQVLEREFLEAGIFIRNRNVNGAAILHPLGFGGFGFGFGATVVTYRNCPNNAPLALWWGSENAALGSALDWFPLFPRDTYRERLLAPV